MANEEIEKVTIYVWADGSWCEEENLEECLQFKSDDCAKVRCCPGDEEEAITHFMRNR